MNDSDLQVPNSEEEYYEKILRDWIDEDGLEGFSNNGDWIAWYSFDNTCGLDGEFSLETLRAIVWWIEKHAKT